MSKKKHKFFVNPFLSFMMKRSLNPIKAQHFLDLLRPRGGGQICPQAFSWTPGASDLLKTGQLSVLSHIVRGTWLFEEEVSFL